MFSNPLNSLSIVALLALCQPQACNTQFFLPQSRPYFDSLSRSSSTASERQLQLGALGLSRGVVDSESVTQNNGGYGYGGTTSIANSRSRTGELNLGGLEIGSTLTASKTQRNGDVSKGLAHNLNVGGLGIGSSLSRDNLHNGFGLQRSQKGGFKLGLGLLNFDLSRHQQQQNSQALTQAQAQAQGEDTFARSNSNSNSHLSRFGGLGITTTQSQSNALSGSRFGHSSAEAGRVNSNGFFRTRRSTGHTHLNSSVRPKRRAQFVPFAYSASKFDCAQRQHNLLNLGQQQTKYGFRSLLKRNTNAQGANTQNNQELNDNGSYLNNGASSIIGSNLATDGKSGQGSAANVNYDNSVTSDGSQTQSQALNFNENLKEAANAKAGTKQIETETGKRTGAHGGSQATESNEPGASSNIANTNSQVYEEGGTSGYQPDSSSQSIFQGANGQNSAAQTNANVNSVQGVGNNGAQPNSGAFGNLSGAQSFAHGRAELRAFKGRKRKLSAFNTQLRPQQWNQTSSSSSSSSLSLSTLEIINESKEINWPKNRIQLYNHYTQQQQQQPQLPPQREQQQPQQKRPQQLHYSSINPNSSTEQFAVIDENERHGRTFTFITDLINSFTEATCIYPCTLEAYQSNRCCETAVVVPQSPPNVCCSPFWPPSFLRPPITIVRPPNVLPPPSLQPLPTVAYPLIPAQCCFACPEFGFYGPPPCIRYTFPGGGPGRFSIFTG